MSKYISYQHGIFYETMKPEAIISTSLPLSEVQKRFPQLGVLPYSTFQSVYKYPLEKLNIRMMYL